MAKRIVPVLAVAVVSGCMTGGGGGLLAGHTAGATNARAQSQVQVMSKSFTIAGPTGFCVDPGATREFDDGAFVVLGSCAAISGNPHDSKPRLPAMLTASVTPADAPLDPAALDRMVAFFSTEAGRTALARADDAGQVTVIDLSRDDGLVFVHAEDGARSGDVAGDYWRAIFDVSGQLVTVTVSGFRETPLDGATGAALARSFVKAIRTANRAGGVAGPGTTGNAAANAGASLATFFNRLP